jgi:hypothetical protein
MGDKASELGLDGRGKVLSGSSGEVGWHGVRQMQQSWTFSIKQEHNGNSSAWLDPCWVAPAKATRMRARVKAIQIAPLVLQMRKLRQRGSKCLLGASKLIVQDRGATSIPF